MLNDKVTPLLIEKIKLKLKTVLFLAGMWILAGLFFSVNELLAEKSTTLKLLPDAGNNTGALIMSIMLTSLVVGLITGGFQAFMPDRLYSRRHLGKMIMYNTVFYLFIYFCLFFAGLYIYKEFFSGGGITISEFRDEVKNYFLSSHALMSLVIFGAFVVLSLFLLYTREKFGINGMSQLFSGKYFYPVEEERIFMFLDIKSATTIAEKLGPLKYHEFLNDFYREITFPILYKKGEIYQYVGDEITISWSIKDGIKKNNCVECFFEIQKTVNEMEREFIGKYGVVPEFKAALHCGKTVTGEMGIIKREIVYSGDTLNTTARIEALCNKYGEQLLISGDLMNRLSTESKFRIRSIGEQLLRGRNAKIEVFGVSKESNSKPFIVMS